MSLKEQYRIPARNRQWALGLMGAGVLSLIVGYFMYGTGDNVQKAHFWGSLLQNSVYFLLVVNAAMFFLCATTLAMGGFQLSFKRVTEAISACVIPIGILTFIIMMIIVFGNKTYIYEWLDKDLMNKDEKLLGKKGFLNPAFFTIWSILIIGLWTWLGYKMRKLSRDTDSGPLS